MPNKCAIIIQFLFLGHKVMSIQLLQQTEMSDFVQMPIVE